MDKSNIITLLSSNKEQDEYGVWRETYTENTVYCSVESVSAQEFHEGGRNGLNPAYRMVMFFGDYNGERLLEYDGETYAIYRTYRRKGDFIELYVERKGGTNGRS
jgi:hypothetical protein